MIKLTNYTQYGSKEVFILKTMIHSMERTDYATSITMENGGVYAVQETPEEILAMPDIEEGNKVIDWGQRRYEVAKDILPVIYSNGQPEEGEFYLSPEDAANLSVKYADALIKELKK